MKKDNSVAVIAEWINKTLTQGKGLQRSESHAEGCHFQMEKSWVGQALGERERGPNNSSLRAVQTG